MISPMPPRSQKMKVQTLQITSKLHFKRKLLTQKLYLDSLKNAEKTKKDFLSCKKWKMTNPWYHIISKNVL